jgi:hypothetical protein
MRKPDTKLEMKGITKTRNNESTKARKEMEASFFRHFVLSDFRVYFDFELRIVSKRFSVP